MKVVTPVVNSIDFIELQHKTLQKFMPQPYEFIVFNDAKTFPDYTNDGDITLKNRISKYCHENGITCIELTNHQHSNMSPSSRTANVLDTITMYARKNPDDYLIIDSDMFLIDTFDIEKYKKYNCAVLYQERPPIEYIWNGIAFFSKHATQSRLHNLSWSCVYKDTAGDTGWATQEWLKSQDRNNIFALKHLWSNSWNESQMPLHIRSRYPKLLEALRSDVRNQNGNLFSELYDNFIIHYRAGSNWMKNGLGVQNTQVQYIKQCLFEEL